MTLNHLEKNCPRNSEDFRQKSMSAPIAHCSSYIKSYHSLLCRNQQLNGKRIPFGRRKARAPTLPLENDFYLGKKEGPKQFPASCCHALVETIQNDKWTTRKLLLWFTRTDFALFHIPNQHGHHHAQSSLGQTKQTRRGGPGG